MFFLLLVIAVSLGMNWYVLARLHHLWGLEKGGRFYGLLVPLSLSFITALVLENRIGNAATGLFYTLAMTWFGLCWMLCWLLLVQQALARIIRVPRRFWAVGACSLAGVLLLYSAVNARSIAVRRETVPGLPARIVHLSDIHLGSIGEKMLGEIIAETGALRPDLVLITGDLFDNANPTTRAAAARLGDFASPVFFTSGNHETYTGYDEVRQMLAGSRIRWLRNEVVEAGSLRLVGLDDNATAESMRRVLDRVPSSPLFTVLLVHRPIGLDLAARYGVDLTLAGHVHDGQIWPFGYFVRLLYPYAAGLHEHAGRFLNVSTGAGYWGPPLRLGSRSEIVLLEPAPRP